ncbi:MAG: M28 family peptidase [Nitrospiria bacterium]
MAPTNMKIFAIISLCFPIILSQPAWTFAEGLIHHDMKVVLEPDAHILEVEDRIVLPASHRPGPDGRFHFLLHGGLNPRALTPGVRISREAETPGAEGFDSNMEVAHYAVSLPIGLRVFVLSYGGEIYHPLTRAAGGGAQEDETLGIISSEGVFLSGKTLWAPWFYNDKVSFTLNLKLPSGWNAVSQGERTISRTEGSSIMLRWESPEPQEEIYLVAGKWFEYQRDAGRVTAMVFLRSPDAALAEKYLAVTEQYLEMYGRLIGPYPYKKFALVENFWETGYGMPSFTLLGPKVIRFPFILHSSYPHEILHNWWGNGVYVDRDTGNWSEGLTSYLSDYLIQEQQEKGLAARRASLEKYADYVSEKGDFPLADFRARHDAASQAVGYGKTLFLFHMLRRNLGDSVFTQALRTFYQDYRFKKASFSDLMQSFQRTSGKDLSIAFDQWVKRTGAPIIRVKKVRAEKDEAGGYMLTALIQQLQKGLAYSIEIPLAVTLHTSDDKAFYTTVVMTEKEQEISLSLPARPIRVDVDPEFDVFRRLHAAEMPPSFSKILGASFVTIVLPSTETDALRQGYQDLAESWQRGAPMQIEITWDNQLEALPKDRAIWLFGWKNRFQGAILSQLQAYGVSTNSAITRIDKVQIPRRNHSLVLAARHPLNQNFTVNWLATDHAKPLRGLERKLFHYGPFGYLAFEGDAPKNIVRGRWPVVRSPMSIRVTQADGKWVNDKKLVLPQRTILTMLPSIFSKSRIKDDISFLSSKAMRGRGFGTEMLDRAAEYIAKSFRESGLQPGGPFGKSYLQQWKGQDGGLGSGVVLKNVIGVLPGSHPDWNEESVVIAAHYDHLGFGWPRVEKGDEGKLHPGANDNASGVALLLDLARLFGKGAPLKRSIVFVAFTGKEVDLRGSRHFVSRGEPYPTERVSGMINLDTIGGLGTRHLIVLGSGSAREWPPLLREAGAASGISMSPIPGTIGSSDHLSFIEAGVPAIQLFSGITTDTGRPTDTIEKIDLEGIVKTGRIVKAITEVLADRLSLLAYTPIQRNDPNLLWRRRLNAKSP